ncbi:MAG TPA: hypothetical protein VMI54_02765 [Polyangiaceae bacterium]|nr:hypothetical protein [Polyangiaceae bacterium]
MDGKPSFEHIFRLTGVHLGAGAAGFVAAALLFAPKPHKPAELSARAAQILELRTQARAVASANPGVGAGTAGAPGAASAASAVAPPASTSVALARATELCKALAWPACDADSVRAMGKVP